MFKSAFFSFLSIRYFQNKTNNLERINVEEMDTRVTNAPNTGTPLFSMTAKVQAPPGLSLSQLRSKLADVGDELDVDIDLTLPLN